jgi:site-specific DNA-methyltransferase (adenine-specific)
MGRIIQGDSGEVMKTLEANSIDLTITSPPYDEVRLFKGHKWDCEAIIKELYRITKEGGVVVWVVADQYIKGGRSGSSFRQAIMFQDIGFKIHDVMIYQKSGTAYPAGSKSTRYTQIYEFMFVFCKGKIKTHNLIKDKVNRSFNPNHKPRKKITKNKHGESIIQPLGNVVNQMGYRNNIWTYSTGAGNTSKNPNVFKHPSVFPEKLAEDHILTWSNEDDLVLDCFAGSGTTLKMAKNNNRKYIGIEIDEEYCNIIKENLQSFNN